MPHVASPGIEIIPDASLRALNTFGVDARCTRLVRLHDPRRIEEALAACEETPRLVLGGGSNLLLTRDIAGPVLAIATKGICWEPLGGTRARAWVCAGEGWHDFVQATLAEGYGGLENLSLIPGQVGAAPIQNIGAYGVELAERLHEIRAIDLITGERRTFSRDDCRFGYRDSVFKQDAGRRWLIIEACFELDRAAALKLDYGELRAELERRGATSPDHRQLADAVCAIRRRKLPDPARIGNAGSFFKNPILSAGQARALRRSDSDVPLYPVADSDQVKVAAGWLIERCGWKGFRDGDAGVHRDHALVLVNHGSASGLQLLDLARRIQQSVRSRFGIELEPEPRIV